MNSDAAPIRILSVDDHSPGAPRACGQAEQLADQIRRRAQHRMWRGLDRSPSPQKSAKSSGPRSRDRCTGAYRMHAPIRTDMHVSNDRAGGQWKSGKPVYRGKSGRKTN